MTETDSSRVGAVRVFGDSLSAFASALEFARIGIPVTLVTRTVNEWPQGALRDEQGTIRDLIAEVSGEIDADEPDFGSVETASAPAETAQIRVAGKWLPMPEQHILGVPANVFDPQLKAIAGTGFRVYLDRLLPVFRVGKYRELLPLVASRMGQKVASATVAPLLWAKYGVAPEHVEVDAAIPGLNNAITKTGSLSGAVLLLSGERAEQKWIIPKGGWAEFREKFLTRLRSFNVDVRETVNAGADNTAVVADSGASVTSGNSGTVNAATDTLDIYDGFAAIPDGTEIAGWRETYSATVPKPAWLQGSALAEVGGLPVTIQPTTNVASTTSAVDVGSASDTAVTARVTDDAADAILAAGATITTDAAQVTILGDANTPIPDATALCGKVAAELGLPANIKWSNERRPLPPATAAEQAARRAQSLDDPDAILKEKTWRTGDFYGGDAAQVIQRQQEIITKVRRKIAGIA